MSADEEDFTDDELLAMQAGSALMEAQQAVLDSDDDGDEYKRGGGVWYERVRGVAEPGSFHMPRHATEALGGGDLRTAGAVLARLFRVDPESPTVIPAAAVKHIGGGNMTNGRRVLQRFISKLRTPRHTTRGAA